MPRIILSNALDGWQWCTFNRRTVCFLIVIVNACLLLADPFTASNHLACQPDSTHDVSFYHLLCAVNSVTHISLKSFPNPIQKPGLSACKIGLPSRTTRLGLMTRSFTEPSTISKSSKPSRSLAFHS